MDGIRQKPLQKSMMLPGKNPQFVALPPQPRPIQPTKHNHLRGSSIPLVDPWLPISPRGSHVPQSFPAPLYTSNTPSNQSSKRIPTQQDIRPQVVNTPTTPTAIAPAEMEGSGHNTSRSRDNRAHPIQQIRQNNDKQAVIAAVIEQVKEQHLPAIISSLRKELQKDVVGLKEEVSQLKVEVRRQAEKEDVIKKELSSLISLINTEYSPRKSREATPSRRDDLEQMQKKLEGVEKGLEDRIKKVVNELQEVNQKLQTKKNISFGMVGEKSSLPSVLLQYRQSYSLKSATPFLKLANGTRELVLSSYTYHIDREGFLLDGEGCYLVDGKGQAIRVEEQHLQLLRRHSLLS